MKLSLNLDASVLGHSGCLLSLKRRVIDGYAEPAQAARLIYGVALHKYFDTMYKTSGHIPTARDEAVKAFNVPKIDDKKSVHLSDQNHMITSAYNAWETIKEDADLEVLMLNGKPASELTFSIKYYEDEHIIVNLCGTMDTLGKIKGGCYLIRDFKSTSSWDARTYFKQYELARQRRIYVLALKLMADLEPDSILGQIGKTNIGFRYDAIFIKPSPNANLYVKSEVMLLRDDDLVAFRKTLDDEIAVISNAVKNNYYPKQGILNGSCDGKWGKCMFWNVCNSPDVISDILLKKDFIIKHFNPLTYNEIV